MKCNRCGKNAKVLLGNVGQNYCDRHFTEAIEKRIRKDLRTNESIDVKNEYFLYDDGSAEAELTEYFLRSIFKGILRVSKTRKKDSKNLILPHNLDMIASGFIESLAKNEHYAESAIAPLRTVMKSEIDELCRIMKMRKSPGHSNEMLDAIEKRYPGAKFAVLKTVETLDADKKRN